MGRSGMGELLAEASREDLKALVTGSARSFGRGLPAAAAPACTTPMGRHAATAAFGSPTVRSACALDRRRPS
jgi:hypothetical protein